MSRKTPTGTTPCVASVTRESANAVAKSVSSWTMPGVARRLAVLQVEPVLLVVADEVERAVVVDVAVLEDLDERRAAMRGRAAQDVGQALLVGVDRARDERRLGAEREAERVERVVDAAVRRRAGDLALLARRRVLALRQPVDPVVEHQDLDVHVAAQRVDQVVAADRQRVAVTGDDPDRQIRAATRRARSRSPARGRGSSACRRSACSTGTAPRSRCRR